MRRPNRRPNYTKMEDITDWTETVDYVIRLNGSIYEAFNGSTGEVDSSNLDAATVIQYALDNTTRGTVKVVDDVSLGTALTGVDNVTLDFTEHRVTITADVDFYIADDVDYASLKNVEIYCPDSYTANIIHLYADTGSIYWSNFENIRVFDTYENFTYTGLKIHSTGTKSVRNCAFRDIVFWNVNKGIHWKTDTADGFMVANILEHIFVNHFIIGMDFEIFDDPGSGPNHNTFIACEFQTSANSTYGIKDTANAGNVFHNCIVWDWVVADFPVEEWSVATNANNTCIIGMDESTEDIIDNGNATMILGKYSEMKLKYINRGTQDQDIRFFKDTDGNPALYIYGDDTGAERVAKFTIVANGALQISQETGGATIKWNDIGEIEMNGTAPQDVSFFGGSGAGENRYINLGGRDNANANVRHMKLRWGGTANDEGEIVTDSGDIFLNAAGVVKFGTKTGTGDAVLDGYVTIKDAAGNTIKLATTA